MSDRQTGIEIGGVTKRFGGVVALEQVDLSIADGEIFALLGPNGAGKTTLISVVSGIVNPTSGSVSARVRLAIAVPIARSRCPVVR